ncbi:MAG: hypothetical protein U0946_07250, partial [Patescibacteria group bacterium]|nr:hypothetical protein [Patescibacteria group bacterium]
GDSVFDLIAERSGQTIGQVKGQAFDSSRREFSGGEASFAGGGWSFPAQEAYRELLGEGKITIPGGIPRKHAEVLTAQPTGSDPGPVRPQA